MKPSDIRKYEFIDALRGLAILGVILVHSAQVVSPTNETLLWLMGEGARGVQLFFVVSALTLCMSWHSRTPHEISPVRNFYIRRIFRIAPMFYLAIAGYILAYGLAPSYWAPNGIQWWFIPATAAFLHGFHPETINSVVPGDWSIAAEISFYVILPFLLPRIRSIKSCVFVLAASLVLSGLDRIIVPQIPFYPDDQHYLLSNFASLNFIGQLPVFIIGILSYLILENRHPRKQLAVIGGASVFGLGAVFLYPVFEVSSSLTGAALLRSPHDIVAGGLFATLAILLANWPSRLLVNRITTSLGKLSFSMYLTQFAILSCFSRSGISGVFPATNLGSLLHFLCVAVVVGIVSAVSYRHIEKPGIALGKRLIERLDHSTVVSVGTQGRTDAAQ